MSNSPWTIPELVVIRDSTVSCFDEVTTNSTLSTTPRVLEPTTPVPSLLSNDDLRIDQGDISNNCDEDDANDYKDPKLALEGPVAQARMAISDLQSRHLRKFKDSFLHFTSDYYKKAKVPLSSLRDIKDHEIPSGVEFIGKNESIKEYFYASNSTDFKFGDLLSKNTISKYHFNLYINEVDHTVKNNLLKVLPFSMAKNFTGPDGKSINPENVKIIANVGLKDGRKVAFSELQESDRSQVKYFERYIEYGELIVVSLKAETVESSNVVLVGSSMNFPNRDLFVSIVAKGANEEFEEEPSIKDTHRSRYERERNRDRQGYWRSILGPHPNGTYTETVGRSLM